MQRDHAIDCLKQHERALRDMGVARLSLFGSTARGEAGPASDVDVAIRFDGDDRLRFDHFLDVEDYLRAVLNTHVDMVHEPVRKARLQAEIDRDRVHVF